MQSDLPGWNIHNYYIDSSDLAIFTSEQKFGYLIQCHNRWYFYSRASSRHKLIRCSAWAIFYTIQIFFYLQNNRIKWENVFIK